MAFTYIPPTDTRVDWGTPLGQGLSRAITGIVGGHIKRKEARNTEFQGLMNIPMQDLMSDKNMESQVQALDEFKSKWSNEYKLSKGKLTSEQKIAIEKEKNSFLGWQTQKLQDVENFTLAQQEILKDKDGFYDRENFYNSYETWMNDGEVDSTPQALLKNMSLNPSEYFNNLKVNVGDGKQSTYLTPSNKEVKTTKWVTQEQRDSAVLENMYAPTQDGKRLLKGVEDSWAALPPAIQQKYEIDASIYNKENASDIKAGTKRDRNAKEDFAIGFYSGMIQPDVIESDYSAAAISAKIKKKESATGKSKWAYQENMLSASPIPKDNNSGYSIKGKDPLKLPVKAVFLNDESTPLTNLDFKVDDDVDFSPIRLNRDGMIEGEITVPKKSVEREVTQEEYINAPFSKQVKKGDKYYVKEMEAARKQTVTVHIDNIYDLFNNNYPGLLDDAISRGLELKLPSINPYYEPDKGMKDIDFLQGLAPSLKPKMNLGLGGKSNYVPSVDNPGFSTYKPSR